MLTEIEKSQLRQAICDGAFSNRPQAPGQQGIPLTPMMLEEIANKTDAEVRAVLTIWKANKLAAYQSALIRFNEQLASIQAQIAALTSTEAV